jgi:ABC-type polysaccharide/polyol phosphate transport system ATPase subunit
VISLSASESPATAPADAAAPPTTISVQDLAITYRTNLQKAPTLKSTLVRLGRRERIVREVQALKGISFDVAEGTVMGVVGANGAGKSTLMRSVAGILAPTSGRVEVHGKVSTLLSLGVGFNGALSGRQNVVLGGLAAGLTRKEIAQKYDEITAFAELEEYMDMPMRTYSSGMFGRLAFAVAVHMDPDILLIDEALSAGDAHFKEKARAKMDELAGKARTMLIVSHGLATIRDMCNEAIWLHKGELMMRGGPQEVIDSYTRFLKVGETSATMEDF